METQAIVTPIVVRPLAFRFGDMLPKPLKVIYYILLWVTLIYMIGVISIFLLKVIQKTGAMIFDEKHFYFLVFVLLIVGLITLFLAQYYFDLDPIGHFLKFLSNKWHEFREWIVRLILG